ncbi:MAG: hypothetical protein JWM58_37 [Rhizobium sp.]|nr:hypothetical protein [Rhizobium sp.]
MSGLEQAIRNALDRAERSNPDIRARIYQSARNALDTGLRKQDIEDPVVIERQRQRLEITIRAIEDEELERLRLAVRLEKVFIENTPDEPVEADAPPLLEPVPPEVKSGSGAASVSPPVIEHDAAQRRPLPDDLEDGSLSGLSAMRDERPASAPRNGKRKGAPDQQERHTKREEEDPAWAEPSTPEGRTVTAESRAVRRKSGSLIVSLFVYCVLLGIVVFGAWWVYATGMVDAALNGSGNFEIIPKELQSESFDPAAEKRQLDPLRGFSGEWIDIFKPGESDRVKPSASAKVGNVTDSDGKAITIASSAPDQDGEVRIEVPAAILQDLAGKTSTIAITLRADGDLPSQIYVQCEFTTLGDCGRHRFTVSNERADELIQVKFDGKLGPSDAGYIVFNSDLTGEGRAIRLYGIRVLPGS